MEEQKRKKEELLKHARDKRVEAMPVAQEKETDIHGTGSARRRPSPPVPQPSLIQSRLPPPPLLLSQNISMALSVDSALLLAA